LFTREEHEGNTREEEEEEEEEEENEEEKKLSVSGLDVCGIHFSLSTVKLRFVRVIELRKS